MNWNKPRQKNLFDGDPAQPDAQGRPTRFETLTHGQFEAMCKRVDAGEFRVMYIDSGGIGFTDEGFKAGNARAVWKVFYPNGQP